MSRRAEAPLVERVRLRAKRRVLWMRLVWSESQAEGGQGLAIPHAEVDRALLDPRGLAEAERAFYQSDPEAHALSMAIADADLRAAQDDLWNHVSGTFRLSDAENDLLSLVVAVELDPRLRRVCGYLHDDATACHATQLLASELFDWAYGTRVGAGSALTRFRLARPVESPTNASSMTSPWLADPHIVECVTEGVCSDPALDGAAKPDPSVQDLRCLYPAELRRVRDFVDAIGARSTEMPVEVTLAGADGAGKRTLAAQVAARLGVPLLVVDAAALLGGEPPPARAAENLERVARVALLTRSAVYFRGADAVDLRVWSARSLAIPLTFFGTSVASARERNPEAARLLVTLPPFDHDARMQLWRDLAAEPTSTTVSEWPLTPAEIHSAARVAPAGEQAVVEACRQMLGQNPGELFTPLACPYTWEDIVLPDGTRRALAEFEAQARLRFAVYDEWGFGKLCPTGRGITALFAGPSGTGKTMASQVLARSLGRELYRVDLAGVVNKYIGETEKRLKRVFDACERAGVVLLFDEADALFGQRTQVKDAQDRFANIEIDYLLQRMEQFDGIAILATNRRSDLDGAFLRRLRFVIDFVQPGVPERLALWRLSLPERTPSGERLVEGIDWEYLAGHLTMTGAQIKLAALGAAFLARAEGTRPRMDHVMYAAQRELQKQGNVMRAGNGKKEWQT